MSNGRWRGLAWVAAGVIGAGLGATSASASGTGDQLGCEQRVFDPAGLTGAALERAAEATATRLHADLHVRIEGSLDGDIDGRQRRLERGCPTWTEGGLRADDLLVVMVSPSERETSIYYGDDFFATLDGTDEQIQERVMNPRFRDGDIEQGLIDGLDAIEVAVGGGGVPQSGTVDDRDDFSGSSSGSGSSGSSFPVVGIVALIVLVVAVSALSKWAQENGWATSDSSSGYRRSWSSSSRGFSSSTRRSSSSRRSSSGSRRSGGGGHSSKW